MMVKYCDCEVGACEGRDAAARCVYLHCAASEETVALRADLEAVVVAAKKVLYYNEHLRGEGYSKAMAMDYLKQALDRPGVVKLLEGAKRG